MDLVLLYDGGAHDRMVWIDLMPRAGLPLGVRARLFADDQPMFAIGGAHILLDAMAEGRADQLPIGAPEAIEALLGRVRKASRIRLMTEGRSLGDVSAEGASAVLLWIANGKAAWAGKRPDPTGPGRSGSGFSAPTEAAGDSASSRRPGREARGGFGRAGGCPGAPSAGLVRAPER